MQTNVIDENGWGKGVHGSSKTCCYCGEEAVYFTWCKSHLIQMLKMRTKLKEMKI